MTPVCRNCGTRCRNLLALAWHLSPFVAYSRSCAGIASQRRIESLMERAGASGAADA